MGREKDGRSDDPEVVGTSTRLCVCAAGKPAVAPESNVGLKISDPKFRNLRLDVAVRMVQFAISDFGFEMQDSFNFKISSPSL